MKLHLKWIYRRSGINILSWPGGQPENTRRVCNQRHMAFKNVSFNPHSLNIKMWTKCKPCTHMLFSEEAALILVPNVQTTKPSGLLWLLHTKAHNVNNFPWHEKTDGISFKRGKQHKGKPHNVGDKLWKRRGKKNLLTCFTSEVGKENEGKAKVCV